MIEILDCTLRDGGYVNDFNFREDSIKIIISELVKSRVDYIEVGFLQNTKKPYQNTIFTSIDEIKPLLPKDLSGVRIFAMVVYGKFDISKLPHKSECMLDGIRITFKKEETKEALNYIKAVQKLGYKVSVNPTGINQYSDLELLELINLVNKYELDLFAIVDTLGLLVAKDVLRLFYLLNHNLNKNITICYHSHNNLQLSFSNAIALIAEKQKRNLIIDASVRGMGRGAGNLNTELLMQYINDYIGIKYDVVPILKIIDEQINAIFNKTPWGYSVPYYLAAALSVHPNYASFLIDKNTIPMQNIREILSLIPQEKRQNYDENLIQNLYLEYQNRQVDDTKTLEILKTKMQNKPVLLLGPGRSIITKKEAIREYILKEKPYVVSINFSPKDIKVDNVFISNARRFLQQNLQEGVIITSNIDAKLPLKLNYASYLNDGILADNALLMFLKVLVKVGIKQVALAGMDGFNDLQKDYFYNEKIGNYNKKSFDLHNKAMQEALAKSSLNISFITESLYKI
ncbi:MAG: aldolase catalytic domain-containing protein [Helicobacteraceae bacterium]|nr:aldolase catalytic domain-containing protein [Helicobacteraceae bacterium]